MRTIAALIIMIGAAWLVWPDSDPAPAAAAAPRAIARAAAVAAASQPPGTSMPFFSEPQPAAQQPIPASVSMANTRLHGDPEAPPIVRSNEVPAAPTPQELSDPKAYLAYEARQSVRLYASYVRAVDKQLPILRDDIARGKAIGIAPEKIAKAEEKARRLEAMRAQLLKDHPELVR